MARVSINFCCNELRRKKSVKEALGWFGWFNKFSINSPDPVVVLSDGRITLDGCIKILCPFLGDLFMSANIDSPIIMPDFSAKTFKTFYSVLTKGFAEDCHNFKSVVEIASTLNICMESLILEQVGGGLNKNNNEDREYFEAFNNVNIENPKVSMLPLSKVKSEIRFIKCEETPVLSEQQRDSSDSSQNQNATSEKVRTLGILPGSSICRNTTNDDIIQKPHLISIPKKVSLSPPAPTPTQLFLPRKNQHFISREHPGYPGNRHQHLDENIHSSSRKLSQENKDDTEYDETANKNTNMDSIEAVKVSKNPIDVLDSMNKKSQEFICDECNIVFRLKGLLYNHMKDKHSKRLIKLILAQRKRQVNYFKQTEIYKAFADANPKNQRIGNAPTTPRISEYRTRTQWNKAMLSWKNEVSSCGGDILARMRNDGVDEMKDKRN